VIRRALKLSACFRIAFELRRSLKRLFQTILWALARKGSAERSSCARRNLVVFRNHVPVELYVADAKGIVCAPFLPLANAGGCPNSRGKRRSE
jgi:hypothetical protein